MHGDFEQVEIALKIDFCILHVNHGCLKKSRFFVIFTVFENGDSKFRNLNAL